MKTRFVRLANSAVLTEVWVDPGSQYAIHQIMEGRRIKEWLVLDLSTGDVIEPGFFSLYEARGYVDGLLSKTQEVSRSMKVVAAH